MRRLFLCGIRWRCLRGDVRFWRGGRELLVLELVLELGLELVLGLEP